MSLTDWFKSMESSVKGQIHLSNLLYDWRENRLPRELICQFLNEVVQCWLKKQPFTTPEDSTNKALKALQETKNNKTILQAYLFQGSRELQDWQGCSRVIPARDLIAYNIKERKIGLDASRQYNKEEIDDLVSLGIIDTTTGIDATKGEMKGGRGFGWVTKTSSFNQMLEETRDNPQRADVIRNRLGLGSDHYKNEHLVGIIYPDAVIDENNLSAPTFIEGDSIFYRSLNGEDGWGRTMDLETYDDGEPEAVHPPVPFTAQFKLENLGSPQPPPDINPEEYLQRMRHRWQSSCGFEI